MNVDVVEQQLAAHLAAVLNCDVDAVVQAAALTELGVESMALVELFVFIEKEFGVELMSAGLEREDLATVQTLAAAIQRAM